MRKVLGDCKGQICPCYLNELCLFRYLIQLQCCNVFSLWAFVALTYSVSHFLTFVKRNTAVTSAVDLAKVYEYIFTAVVLLDKSKTFFAVEPFNSSV